MSSTIGEEAVGALLSTLGPDRQHTTIAKFIQNELDAERGKVTLLLLRIGDATYVLRTCVGISVSMSQNMLKEVLER